MNAAVVTVALPATALAIVLLLRSPLVRRLVSAPRDDRWHERDTPSLGGIAIFAGVLAGVGGAVAAGGVHGSRELLGILGGCAIVFAAGLVDDARSLPPVAKLGSQVAASALVLSTGLEVQIVGNRVLAAAIAVLWLVGMTNAFNLLDNMDGLAATLAAIGCGYFAIDAVTNHPNRMVLVLSLAVGLACVAFLPFNLRPGRPAAVFMGDSGSQVLGFALASLGLAASWKAAGTTVATLLLPILVLAVPILDTTLVTIVRLVEGRSIARGGRDHTSHRLVYRGLSEKRAVVLLAVIASGIGATSLAYNIVDDPRLTIAGVLLTFALLVQFASFISDVERTGGRIGSFAIRTRRLVELGVDAALIAAAFTASYLLFVQGSGTPYQRHIFTVTLPALLAARFALFIPFGLYRGVWRYAGAREATATIGAVVTSEIVTYAFIWATQPWGDFPRSIFVVDAMLCAVLVGASRLGERALFRTLTVLKGRAGQRRTLIVGAGRGGRSLLRELRETPGEQVIGFVDDDPRLRRRRLQGVPVLGAADEIERILTSSRPDVVLVTIPDAPRERLDFVVYGCAQAGVQCQFVRRVTGLDPLSVLRVGADAE
jgi:UDP-GlcNAc:undecaprenyl-phosphate/decaprenyl-phosphate GlcNAc-1-phosphate transferase